MDLDENDDEVWHSWSSEPVSDLGLVLPKDWPLFHPVQIHPEFLGWFRANYEITRASLPDDQRRYQERHRHGRMDGDSWGRVGKAGNRIHCANVVR